MLWNWNLQRKSAVAAADLVASISREGAWDAIAFQEAAAATGAAWPTLSKVPADFKGHLILGNRDKAWDCCLVVHSRWAKRVGETHSCKWGLAVRLRADEGDIVVGSFHFPNSRSYSADDYLAATAEWHEVLGRFGAYRWHALGMDANVELNVDQLGSAAVGPAALCNLDEATDRQSAFLETCEDIGGFLANTMEGVADAADVWTHVGSSRSGRLSRRQIDFVLCSAAGSCADVARGLAAASDHRPMRLEVPGEEACKLAFCSQPPSLRGWRPRNEDEVAECRAFLASKHPATTTDWQGALRDCASLLAESGAARTGPWACKEEERLRQKAQSAHEAWQEARTANELRRAARRRRKARQALAKLRKSKALAANTRPRCSTTLPDRLVDKQGREYPDQRDWSAAVQQHCRDRFRSKPVAEQEAADARCEIEICAMEGAVRGWVQEHGVRRRWSAAALRKAMAAQKCGSTPALDIVPNELLALLSDAQLDELGSCFSKRVACDLGHCGVVDDWRSFLLTSIPKRCPQRLLANWRGLFLAAALFKVYETVVVDSAFAAARDLPDWFFGFRKGYRPMQVSEALRTLLLKAWEWKLELWIASLDVATAFDKMRASRLFRALRRKGVPMDLAVAIWREQVLLRARVRLGVRGGEEWVPLECGAPQGRRRTPRLWNVYLCDCLEDVVASWTTRPIDWFEEWRWHLLCFADNLFVVASSFAELQRKIRDLSQAIDAAELDWNPDSLAVLPNHTALQNAPADWRLLAGRLLVPRVSALDVLGVKLDAKGSPSRSWAHRCHMANKKWHSVQSVLRDTRLESGARLRKLGTDVEASALFGAGGCPPLAKDMRLLERTENRWLRAMFWQPREPAETVAEHHRRLLEAAHSQRRQCGLLSLPVRALQAYASWLGHLARSSPNSCPAACALGFSAICGGGGCSGSWETTHAGPTRAIRRARGWSGSRMPWKKCMAHIGPGMLRTDLHGRMFLCS